MDLRGTAALVTGGGVRLGRACAEALAGQGARVAIHYHRSGDSALSLAAELCRQGGEATTVAGDLATASGCEAVIEAASEAWGGLDVLVNNAAVFLPGGLLDTTLEDWELQMALNVRAPFLLSRRFATLRGTRDGVRKIVNLTDARAARPGVDHLAYRLGKTALGSLTECLALELAPTVTVNAIAPGAILPGPGADANDFARLVRARVPLRRGGGTESVARALLYLLDDDFLTGTTLRVDGGEYL